MASLDKKAGEWGHPFAAPIKWAHQSPDDNASAFIGKLTDECDASNGERAVAKDLKGPVE